MVPDLEDIGLKIRSAIGKSAFGISISITHEQEGNSSSGHLQDDGVLVDTVRKRGGWVEDRDGQAWEMSKLEKLSKRNKIYYGNNPDKKQVKNLNGYPQPFSYVTEWSITRELILIFIMLV